MLLVFFFLLWLHRHRRFPGQVILAYALLYTVIRFAIEFLRDDPRGDLFGLTTLTHLSTSQLISLVVGVEALILLLVRWRRSQNPTAANLAAKPARV
jgi:phosphatidylglycerol:prolipoprotein diacylglycerol transferase